MAYSLIKNEKKRQKIAAFSGEDPSAKINDPAIFAR
jgi:hypothetical protein